MKKSYGIIVATATLGFLAGCGQVNRATPTSSLQGVSPGASGSQAQLTWTSNKGEQQGFDIEQSTDGTTYTQIQSVPDGTNAVTIVTTPGQKYYFRIRSCNQAGFSPYSPVVTKGS